MIEITEYAIGCVISEVCHASIEGALVMPWIVDSDPPTTARLVNAGVVFENSAAN